MLALICGTGHLPAAIADLQQVHPLICVLEGFAPEGLAADITFRLEGLGRFLQELKTRGVTDICLCGAITRPAIDPALLEPSTLPLVPILQAAMARGDDGALRAVIDIFENHGFHVRAATEIAPDLLPPAGILTTSHPPSDAETTVAVALDALRDMDQMDVGQACVVRAGQVLASEKQDGTDAMLCRLSDAPKAMLFKAPKPGQDRRADLPTIGPQTAERAASLGMEGLTIEAGGVIVLNLPQVLEILNQSGLYLWVRRP